MSGEVAGEPILLIILLAIVFAPVVPPAMPMPKAEKPTVLVLTTLAIRLRAIVVLTMPPLKTAVVFTS